MKLDNQHLSELEVDHFHHLGFSADSKLLKSYEDVKFVCLSGSTTRVKKFAKVISKELNIQTHDKELLNLCLTDRYVMYKVGPVLLANHGMGCPSTCIILNEIFKLLHYANAKDVTFFRIGTSGGLGIKAGTVVLTKKAVNGCLEPKMTNIVLGEVKEHNTEFQHSNFDKLLKVSETINQSKPYDFLVGDTMCCDDFYEGQGRMDGAFCKFTKEEKMNYLQKAYDVGVRNIEMEGTVFAAMCNQAEVPGFIVCVTLLNRLEGDQILISQEELHEFEHRPFDLVCSYIKSYIEGSV